MRKRRVSLSGLLLLAASTAVFAWGLYLSVTTVVLNLMPPASYAGGLGFLLMFFGGMMLGEALTDDGDERTRRDGR